MGDAYHRSKRQKVAPPPYTCVSDSQGERSEDGDCPAVGEGSEEERFRRIEALLSQPLPPSLVDRRPGPGKQDVFYLSGANAIRIANFIFGVRGWGNKVLRTEEKSCVRNETSGQWSASIGLVSEVEVTTLGSGSYVCRREDVGYGSCERANTELLALESAGKEAATDGLKRALRLFGDALGTCLYDRHYVEWLKKQPRSVFGSNRDYSKAEFFKLDVPSVKGEIVGLRQGDNGGKVGENPRVEVSGGR